MSRRSDDGDSVHIGGYTPADVAFFTRLANEAAEAGIKRAFISMGLNPDQPLVSQRYFQVLSRLAESHDDEEDRADNEFLRRFRKLQDTEDGRLDVMFVRRWRRLIDGLVGKIIAAAAGLVVVGALRVLWDGFKAAMSK